MSNEITEISKRAEFSRSRLDQIRARIRESDVLDELPCVSITNIEGIFQTTMS